MLNEIIISICIPTYNRAHTLINLLSSIVKESKCGSLANSIEVVVSDNASTDNTEELINFFSNKIKNLKYVRLDENKGFGVNLTNAIHHSSGRYCWLMGSDEKLCEGALFNVINLICNIEQTPDVILGNAITNGVERHFYFNSEDVEPTSSKENFSDFINNCTEFSSCLAFMSTIILKKRIFESDIFPVELVSHPYTHMLRGVYFIKNSECRLKLLGWPLVDTGSEVNEWNSLVLNHFRLDYQTAYTICHDIFNDKLDVVNAFSCLLKRQYSPLKLILSRACASQQEWDEIKFVLDYFGVLSNKKPHDFLIKIMYKYIKKIKRLIKYAKS